MMQVLSVAAEVYPLVKTGGLGDVVGALRARWRAMAWRSPPWCPDIPPSAKYIGDAPLVHHYGNLMGAEARILASRLNGHPLLVLDAPALFLRDGGIYGDRSGSGLAGQLAAFRGAGACRCGSCVRCSFQLAL